MKQYDIKLLILSRGRSDAVSTANLLPDWVEMLVPVSEVEEYTKRYANPILTIPDEIMGLGPVRNWVLDNFKENIVIMINWYFRQYIKLPKGVLGVVTRLEKIGRQDFVNGNAQFVYITKDEYAEYVGGGA